MDTSKSYFVKKLVIKNKVKRKIKKIIEYEDFKNMIKNETYQDAVSVKAIELINEIIDDYKNKIKNLTELYVHG